MSQKRSPGRPRDQSVGRRVTDSTLGLLQEEGLAGISIDAIAARAGVSKAAIYRRWESKEELLVDTVAGSVEKVDIPDTGDLRGDLTFAVRGMRSFVCDTPAGGVFPWLVGEIAGGTPIGIRYANAVIKPRRAILEEMIARAVDRGELRPDLVPATAVDMLMGPVIMRKITGRLDASPPDWPEILVDSLLGGWQDD